MADPDTDRVEPDDILVKPAAPGDLDGIVTCHTEAFPGQGMTEMGPAWLRSLYSCFIQRPEAVLLIAVDGSGHLLGFVAGGNPGIRSEWLPRAARRYCCLLALRFFTSGVVRSSLLAELRQKLRSLRRRSKTRRTSLQEDPPRREGSLLSIAVLPSRRGSGIAGRLMASFCRECASRDYDVLRLSVRPKNSRAISFYKKHRWRETSRNDSVVCFAMDLTGERGSG